MKGPREDRKREFSEEFAIFSFLWTSLKHRAYLLDWSKNHAQFVNWELPEEFSNFPVGIPIFSYMCFFVVMHMAPVCCFLFLSAPFSMPQTLQRSNVLWHRAFSALAAEMSNAASEPRVASLLPSATEIMGHLKLQHLLVGVSHECDVSPEKSDLDELLAKGSCVRLTSSEINPMQMSQEEINTAVEGSLRMGDSLYGILESEFRAAKPTVVLTQALCNVCAPSAQQVAGACGRVDNASSVINLEPHTLSEVAETFITVSQAVTGSPASGKALASKFEADINRISCAVQGRQSKAPRCVLLEPYLLGQAFSLSKAFFNVIEFC